MPRYTRLAIATGMVERGREAGGIQKSESVAEDNVSHSALKVIYTVQAEHWTCHSAAATGQQTFANGARWDPATRCIPVHAAARPAARAGADHKPPHRMGIRGRRPIPALRDAQAGHPAVDPPA